MANYGLKYTKTLTHKGGQIITLRIYEKYDTTAPTQMTIGSVVVGLDYGIQGRESSVDTAIQKTSLTLSLIDAPERNTSSEKWGGWEEFYTPDATKYMVRLLVDGVLQWSGFITPDSYDEDLSYHAPVTITARDNWGRLNDFTFDAEGENGLITVSDLITAAVEKAGVDMAVSINNNAVWPLCDGIALYDHYVNVKAFDGDTWWTALEDTLSSLGMVITYEGNGKFLISPLRARMLKGEAEYSSVAKTSFVFEHPGHRSLSPACREIVEKQEYEFSRDMMNIRELRMSDFVAGSSYPFTTQPYGTAQATMPVYALSSSSPWKNGSGTYYSILNQFGYTAISGDDAVRLSDARTLFLAANPGTASDYATAPNKMRGAYCDIPMTKMMADIHFHIGEAVRLYNNKTNTGSAVYDESYTSPAIARVVAMMSYTTVSGITYYWSGSAWQSGAGQFVDLKPESDDAVFTADIMIPAANINEPGTLRIHFRCGVYIIRGEYTQAHEGEGMYMPITDIRLISTREVYARHKVTTKYVDTNNVIIQRSPKIGAVNFDTSSPYQVLNGVYSPSVGHPASREWYWPDNQSSKHQLPVLIHTQILPYHARPMNVLTGTVIKDSLNTLPTFSELWEYKGREYMLLSGRVDLLSGRLVNAELREFILYENMWDGSFPSTASSATIARDGESEGTATTSASSTSVSVGPSGGAASITIDTAMSDSSTNTVQNKVIKSYVDEKALTAEADANKYTDNKLELLEIGLKQEDENIRDEIYLAINDYAEQAPRRVTIQVSGLEDLIGITNSDSMEQIGLTEDVLAILGEGKASIVYDNSDTTLIVWNYSCRKVVSRNFFEVTFYQMDNGHFLGYVVRHGAGTQVWNVLKSDETLSNLALDFQGLYDLIPLSPNVIDSDMDAIGLSASAIDNILTGKYNKIVGVDANREVWDYGGYERNNEIFIFLSIGDGFDIHNAYSLFRNTSGTWRIIYAEI